MTKTRKKTTVNTFIESLNAKERKKFDQEYQELLLSELLIGAMEKDDISVRKLAKIAGISPTIIQAMRSGMKKDFTMQSFFKVLKGIGCKRFMVELNGQFIPLDISLSPKR